MKNPGLDQSAFIALGKNNTNAFLPVADAISGIADRYRKEGLLGARKAPDADAKGEAGTTWVASDVRHVARPVALPRGTRLYKLTARMTTLVRDATGAWTYPTLSPWWSPFARFEDSDLSAGQVFETAILNQVTMRDYVRFAAAVSLDWNPLSYYTEITITEDIGAFWGQFAPQPGLHVDGDLDGDLTIVEVDSPSGPQTMVVYGDSGEEVYLPPTLGGVGAWQLFVPAFSKDWIDPDAVLNIDATDTDALARHFGVSAARIAELHAQGAAVRR